MTSRSLTVWQAMAMFFLILIIGVTLSLLTERQQNRIEQQQREIVANAQVRVLADWQGCLGGREIILRYNRQQDSLAAVEQSLLDDPQVTALARRVANKRVNVYARGKITPVPDCGPRPQ